MSSQPATALPPLHEIVAAVFELEADQVTDAAGQDTIPAWTSMRHLELIFSLEEAYQLSFTYREISGARTVGALRDILRAHGVPT